MEELRGIAAPQHAVAGVWAKPCVIALAVALALGLSACGGGGGGGGNGNVRPTPPPASGGNGGTGGSGGTGGVGGAGGTIDVGANASSVVSDLISGTTGITKTGAGTLTLTNVNTYSGSTQVNAGSLYINGNQSAATGATSVASAATLGGNGVIGGDVTLADGATLSPGANGAVGTLTINGNLSLASGSVLNFGFGQANGTSQSGDLVNVKGNLTLDGLLNVDVASVSDPGPGVHRLFNYGGTLTDNGLTLGDMLSVGWAVQTGVAQQVNLVDTRGMVFSFWDGEAGPKGNNVIEGGNGTWTAGGPGTNWTDPSGAVNAQYDNGAFAVFQGAPGIVTVDGDNGAVHAIGMQFATDGYRVKGDAIWLDGLGASGSQSVIRVGDGTQAGAGFTATIDSVLTGDSALLKSDAGTLVLGGENTYTGGTTISGGVLRIGHGGSTGSVVGDILDNGTLAFNRSDTTTYTGTVSGSGNLVKEGQGTLSLVMRHTFTGGTQVKGGTLSLDLGAELGTGDVTVGNADDRMSLDPLSTLRVGHQSVLTNHVFLQGNGVVDNAGVLGGVGYTGIDSNYFEKGSVSVLNHDGGRITGSRVGVQVLGYDAAVTNGTGALIEGGDTGIQLNFSGRVGNDGAGSTIRATTGVGIVGVNGGTIDITNRAGATITGDAGAVSLWNRGSVVNDGVGSSIASTRGYGVRIGDEAFVQNVNGASISAAKTAIYLVNGGSVMNGAGSTIQTTGVSTGDCAISDACAIRVDNDGPSWLTEMRGVTLTNAGTLVGDVQLVPNAMNRVTLVPGGSIHGDLDIGSSALSSLTLDGAAGSSEKYSQVVTGHTRFSTGGLAVVSKGTWVIDNDELTPGVVSVGAGSTLRIGDGGTQGWLATGLIANHGTLVFDRSDDVAFAGGIVGTLGAPYDDLLVKDGVGKLTLKVYGFAPSNIQILEGTLQIGDTGSQPAATSGYLPVYTHIQNDGALIFSSHENLGTIDIAGAGSLTQNGSGVLDLDGQNSYTGGTTVNKGTVRASYVIPGNVFVNAAGTLDGNSPDSPRLGLPGVSGDLANGGIVAVHGRDASIGGNFSQSSTGTLAVSLGSKLAVAGTATLDGTLKITGADTGYVADAHTDVLTAAGGVTGTFDSLVKDTGVVFTSSTINYTANSVWLDTTGLNVTTAAAGNGVTYTPASFRSAQRVQAAFDALNLKIAGGDTTSVPAEFVQAAGAFQQAPTLQAAQSSLRSLSGQLHAASAAMTFESIDASSRALSDHFDDLLGKQASAGMWTQSLNVGGDMGRAGYNGVGFQLNGWLVGSDQKIGSSGVAGFAFGQSSGQQHLDRSADRNRSRSTEAMLYAGWLGGNWYTQGRIGFGQFRQDVSRQLLLGTSMQGVSTNYGGNYNTAYGESGLQLDLAGTRVMPFASVEYTRIDRDGFSEQGAGGFGLRASAQALDRWQAGLGLRASRHWSFDGGRALEFSAGARFRRTLASHGDAFDASFVGLQQWQPLVGIGLSRYSGVFNVGLDATLSARTSLKFGYDYQKGQREQAQTVTGRLVMAL